MNSVLVAIPSEKEMSRLYPQLAKAGCGVPYVVEGEKFDVAVCGVGLLEFAVNLSAILAKRRYESVFQVGICGAYPSRGLSIGDVVRVQSEIVGDMGVQEADGFFSPWSRIGGGDATLYKETGKGLPAPLGALRTVSGISVNCCTGTKDLAQDRVALFDVDVESMEGAALHAVCARFGIPGYEFRAVSNMVSDRDSSTWKINEALASIRVQVLDHINEG